MQEIDDLRERGWYWISDKIIDTYGHKIGPAGIAVYNVLARHAGRFGIATPGKALIAAKTGLSPSSVNRAIKTLIEYKLIKVERRYRDSGRQTSNRYQLINPPDEEDQSLDNIPSERSPSLSSPLGVTQTPPRVSHRHPEGVTQTPPRVSHRHPPRGEGVTQTPLEPEQIRKIIANFAGQTTEQILANARFKRHDHTIIIQCASTADMLVLAKPEMHIQITRATNITLGEKVTVQITTITTQGDQA